jgi:phage shock protein PspC (stress-responsive transcriptional regulator)
MNKTTSISIGRTNFFIEEGAYARLDTYLDSIRIHFAEQEGRDEIIADIEDRIAEKFSAVLSGNPGGAITLENVEAVIAELGTPDAIASQDDAPAAAPDAEPSAKRLMRDPDEALIGGVAAGVAAYFDADVVVVRLIFVLLIVAWGFAIPLYLILWLIMPEAKTQADKMEMRGKPFTISSLAQAAEERMQDAKRSSGRVRSAVAGVLQGLGKLIRILFSIALKLGGIGIAALSALAIAGLTFAAAVLMANTGSPSLRFPFQAIAIDEIYYVLVALAYLFLAIPGVFTLLGGIALFSKRSPIGMRTATGLIGLWMLSGIAAGVLAIDRIPRYVEQASSAPEIKQLDEARDIGKFARLSLSGNARYILKQGDTYSLLLRGTRSAIDGIKVSEQDGMLAIGWTRAAENGCGIFCPHIVPTIEITAPSFSAIEAADGSTVTASLPDRKVSLAAKNAHAFLDLKADSIALDASDSRIELSGSAKSIDAKLSSYSHLDASQLETANASLRAISHSEASINPLSSLLFSTDQDSSVEYADSPSLRVSSSTAIAQ